MFEKRDYRFGFVIVFSSIAWLLVGAGIGYMAGIDASRALIPTPIVAKWQLDAAWEAGFVSGNWQIGHALHEAGRCK